MKAFILILGALILCFSIIFAIVSGSGALPFLFAGVFSSSIFFVFWKILDNQDKQLALLEDFLKQILNSEAAQARMENESSSAGSEAEPQGEDALWDLKTKNTGFKPRVRPKVLPMGLVECPVCGKAQRKELKSCWKCGAEFIRESE